jgi:phosphate-selective porin OprO and OprP
MSFCSRTRSIRMGALSPLLSLSLLVFFLMTSVSSFAAASGEESPSAASKVPEREGTKTATEEEVPLTAGFNGSHFYIASKDKAFQLEFGGRLHLDYRAYSDERKAADESERATPPNSFLLRRARFEVEGTLFKDEENPSKDLYFQFKVQADFADAESTLLRDGYLDIHVRDEVQVMAGQFKAPFSQEELQSSKYMNFVERSSLNNLVPSRSPGVMVYGQTPKSIFQYAFSLQNDRGELGLNDAGTGPDVFGRVRFEPWSGGALRKLAFGGAVGKGRRDHETLIIGRTSSRSVVFFSRVPLNGDLRRRNVEAAWYYKNLGIETEYDEARAQRRELGANGADLPDLEARGYLFQTLYVLTGEYKGEGGITPKRSLDERGPGAWEIGFRYERFEVDDGDLVTNVSQTYTFGLNWWLNKFLRYQSNFVLERFRTPPAGFSDDSLFAYLTRIQLIF